MNKLSIYANIMGLQLNDEQIKAFIEYYYLVIEGNKKVNLTRIVDPDEFAIKHIMDSLSCFCDKVFVNNYSMIDIGTGAGFPGIPLKIYQPSLKLTLLDSLAKRVNFLSEAVDKLALDNVTFVHGRAEDLARNILYREKFNVAVSRAVARLNVLCELCLPFVAIGGYFIAMKGAQGAEELSEAVAAIEVLGGEVEKVQEVKLPNCDDKRILFYIKKRISTPGKFPRRAGLPEKNPL